MSDTGHAGRMGLMGRTGQSRLTGLNAERHRSRMSRLSQMSWVSRESRLTKSLKRSIMPLRQLRPIQRGLIRCRYIRFGGFAILPNGIALREIESISKNTPIILRRR